MKKKYGIFMGRMQPFHLGHQAVINEILLDGLIPVIVLGSSNLDRDLTKNPLTFEQRKELIQLVYPNIEIVFIKSWDYLNWTKWYRELFHDIYVQSSIEPKKEAIIYYNEKEIDRCSFTCNNKQYNNTWYTDIFKKEGFATQKIKFPEYHNIMIDANARDIRNNLEEHKHLLDARVYHTLKSWGWK